MTCKYTYGIVLLYYMTAKVFYMFPFQLYDSRENICDCFVSSICDADQKLFLESMATSMELNTVVQLNLAEKKVVTIKLY